MYQARQIAYQPSWLDDSQIKIYTISALHQPVDHNKYLPRLAQVKQAKSVDWPNTPAFAIFHDGASMDYLVLAWWCNGNELFTSVSVNTETGWVEDASRFSFCLYDLEVFWWERNFYIATLDADLAPGAQAHAAALAAYRNLRPS